MGLVSCTGAMKLLGKLDRPPPVNAQIVADTTAGYQAACHGAPLLTVEARNKAMEDGLRINELHKCVDKASFEECVRAQALWTADNTPEALAKAEKEREIKRKADEVDRKLAQNQAKSEADSNTHPAPLVLSLIDANLATEDELARVHGVGLAIAAQIVKARQQARFAGWEDLVRRVVGLSAAQTALFASLGGLTVNGESLSGAPPNGQLAALIRAKEIAREQRRTQP